MLKGIVVTRILESDVEQLVKFVRLITSRSAVRVCPSLFFLSRQMPVAQNLLRRNSEQNFASFDRFRQKKTTWQKIIFEKVSIPDSVEWAEAPLFSGLT